MLITTKNTQERVSRDRAGLFEQQLIPDYARRTDELETTIITLYRKGITTREISDLIEKIYGHHYSPATMSNISKSLKDQVEAFHPSATFEAIRRDIHGCYVSKRTA